jgi:hypothetical protein
LRYRSSLNISLNEQNITLSKVNYLTSCADECIPLLQVCPHPPTLSPQKGYRVYTNPMVLVWTEPLSQCRSKLTTEVLPTPNPSQEGKVGKASCLQAPLRGGAGGGSCLTFTSKLCIHGSPKREKGSRIGSPSPALGEGFRVRATKVGCTLRRLGKFSTRKTGVRTVLSKFINSRKV